MTVPPSTHGNYLSSDHWVHIQDPAGHEVFILSGTVILNPPLVGTSATRWNRGATAFDIPLRGLPDGQGLVIEQWAPTVLLGSIQNDGVSNNAGWAVDDFDVYAPRLSPPSRPCSPPSRPCSTTRSETATVT